MVASAVIGAVGSLGGSLIGGISANSAANKQVAAQQAAIAEQRQMFDVVQGNLQPFINNGAGGIPGLNTSIGNLSSFTDPNNASSPLASLLKLTTPGADMSSTLQQIPGYQFTQKMGQMAVNNSLAAKGLAGPGGPLSTASANFASGLASSTWQNVVQQLLSAYGAGVNGLGATTGAFQNLVNSGSNAASGLATNATQTGANIGTNLSNIGNAQAAGTIGMGNAAITGINGLTSNAILANLLKSPGGGGGSGDSADPAAAFAGGGRAPGRRPILVGERGPEIVMLDRPGTVIPNHALHALTRHKSSSRRPGHALSVLAKRYGTR